MQLITTGNGVQSAEWGVCQKEGAGYSRVYYIKSGEVVYLDAGGRRELSPGRLYVFPSRQGYDIRHNPEKPIECLWFHINFFGYAVDELLEFDVKESHGDTISLIASALENEYCESAKSSILYRTLVLALVQVIVKHPLVVREDARLLEILEYIRLNLFEPSLGVVTMGESLGYSAAHLIRIFKKGMNITPHRYIEMLRLKEAEELLREGCTVSETAYRCGYGDIKNFEKAFKKHYSLSPSGYKRVSKPEA